MKHPGKVERIVVPKVWTAMINERTDIEAEKETIPEVFKTFSGDIFLRKLQ